jgi:hypothetical protein
LAQCREVFVIELARKKIRIAGAALVNKYDISFFLDALKEGDELLGHLRGALSRAADQYEERIGLGVTPKGRIDDHLEVNRAALC